MGVQTILANGAGLFGASSFLFSVATNTATPATPYYYEDIRPIGPDYERSQAEVGRVKLAALDRSDFTEVAVKFTEGPRIGNRSFFLHDNILRILADDLGKQVGEDIVSTPLTVFHEGNWDLGFSPRLDITLPVGRPMVLASGSMYLGFPIFFHYIAVKGGIIEGAEDIWSYVDADFPFEIEEGEIEAVEFLDDGAVSVTAQGGFVWGSLILPPQLAALMELMFGTEDREELIGQPVALFHHFGRFAALRPSR